MSSSDTEPSASAKPRRRSSRSTAAAPFFDRRVRPSRRCELIADAGPTERSRWHDGTSRHRRVEGCGATSCERPPADRSSSLQNGSSDGGVFPTVPAGGRAASPRSAVRRTGINRSRGKTPAFMSRHPLQSMIGTVTEEGLVDQCERVVRHSEQLVSSVRLTSRSHCATMWRQLRCAQRDHLRESALGPNGIARDRRRLTTNQRHRMRSRADRSHRRLLVCQLKPAVIERMT